MIKFIIKLLVMFNCSMLFVYLNIPFVLGVIPFLFIVIMISDKIDETFELFKER